MPTDADGYNTTQTAPGRENLEPAEPGFNDNTVDNDAGADWEPTNNPKSAIIPGHMRSDREGVPAGFTKEEADRAEVQEAQEQAASRRTGVQAFAAAAPTNCRTYWPSTVKVCGEIRKKYDAMGGPNSFLTWPKSNELGLPDGVGRRNEFVNGFIYWHPNYGAHPVTTHFSIAWARTGWERGALGYPTTDEFALSDGIGRKQSFSKGHIYGSLAGLGTIKGAIYDKWVSMGAEKGVLGYPVTDEITTPDGVGRFNRFTGGMMYWHPQHGAHSVRGSILNKWASQGYERGASGYPVEDPKDDGAFRITQKFQRGNISGYESPVPELAEALGLNDNEIDDLYTQLSDDFHHHQIPLREGFEDAYQHAKESLEFTAFRYSPVQPQMNTRAADTASVPATGCDISEFVPPGNARTNRGDVFYSKAVRARIINHGHNGIFLSQGNADPRNIWTVEAVGAGEGVQRLQGRDRVGVCQPTYLSVNTDNATRDRAASWAESKVGKGYNSNFATTRIGNLDRDYYNCSQLIWAAYKHASGGGLDIGERYPYQPYRAGVYPMDILLSHNTRAFN
ncbi:hypothetical protein ACEN2D_06955 [Corynebacterium auriscanis]